MNHKYEIIKKKLKLTDIKIISGILHIRPLGLIVMEAIINIIYSLIIKREEMPRQHQI